MASGASSHIMPAQGKRTSFGGIAGTNASHLLERSKVGLRGSTPDSEALASSDDEPDQLHRLQKVTSNPVAKPVRRASWLTEGQQATARNASIGGNVSFSPISPSTAAPSEHTTWGANTQTSNTTAGRGHSTTTSFPWSNTIWNSDAPKGPPQRLTEVMPSPTTVVPPGSAGLYGDDGLVSPREVSADQAIPFAIPLQPTPKTYRSQSYSVGQLDPDTMKPPPSNYGGGNAYSRPRMGTYAGLQHRPSRPSMLGETSHDSQILGQLQEVDDDEDSLDLSDPGFQQSQEAALTIEQLTRENAMLRQQAAETRDRAAANNIQANLAQQLALRNRRSSRDAPSEGSDPAIYDVDTETQQSFKKDAVNGRRYSEFGANTGTHYGMSTSEHRNMESVRKGQWQSSLGFGGIPEPPQSRRHSFAEVPTRQNSTGVGMETQKVQEALDQSLHIDGKPISPEAFQRNTALTSQNEHGEYATFLLTRPYLERSLRLRNLRGRNFAVNYFSPRMEPTFRPGAEPRPPSSTAMQHAYAQTHYGRSQQLGMSHPRPKQLLFIVTFKCQRADVFYVQENTGLHINKGDLVIVEADRGTDLGTVASDSVPWAEAKELKDKFIEEHHRWLMMFSQHAQNGTVAGQNPNGTPQNAILGSSTGQAGLHDVPSGDLKPKMIKRVAQQHEIQNLREKEGAEAKAKRACQQKVVEHRLRMEILDAEFQMWGKSICSKTHANML